MRTDVTYTCVLDADRESVEFLSHLLACHRRRLGTRTGTRALGPFKQAVLVIRWFLDATRPAQLATDNAIGKKHRLRLPTRGHQCPGSQAPCLEQAAGPTRARPG